MYNLLKFCDSWVLLFLSVLKAASYTLGKVALQLTNWRKNTHTCIFPNHNSTEPYRNVLYLQSTFTNISLALFPFLSSFASWDLCTNRSFFLLSLCMPTPLWSSYHHKPHIPQCFCTWVYNHCAEKEIKAEKPKLAQDHGSDVAITSKVN